MSTNARSALSVGQRVDRLDWPVVTSGLEQLGCSLTDAVLSPSECRSVAGLYDEDDRFRSTIDMARHRFGEGQYRYFDRP
ncbi:MAG: proline hydroxylase, partial [Acidimicrobiia bacterium]|nr:proline hydroxylase [Acidimicrobiia bacterium]